MLNILSTLSPLCTGPKRHGRLCRHCVRGQSDTVNKVDRVEFNFVASVYRDLEFRGNYSAISNNMKLVHWPLMGGLLHLEEGTGRDPSPRRTLLARPGPSSQYQM